MRGWYGFAVLAGCSEYGLKQEPPAEQELAPVIQVDPPAIDFGDVTYGETPERPFTVANVGDAPLHIDVLTITSAGFALGTDPSGVELAPGEQADGTVVFQGETGEQFGQVLVPSDDPVAPSVPIDLHGTPGLPGLLIEPNPVDFGLVEVGTDALAEVTLTNESTDPMDLVNAVVGEPFWLGQLQPITLAPGESRSMNVHFSPVAPVPYEDRLVFTMDGLGEAGVAVIGAGNSTPKAVCGAFPVNPILPAETVTWIGAGSTDPAGRPLTYAWTLTAAPAGSTSALPAGPGPDLPGFVPDLLGPYSARLVVTNDLGVSDACTANIVAVDTKPLAVCSVAPNPAIALVDAVTWSGVGSSDPAGGALTYAWTLAVKPGGSAVGMPGGPAGNPDRSGFVADMAGIYTGQLVVTNPYGVSSDPCLVDLDVVPAEDLWVEMFWSNGGEDMDLHLVRDTGALDSNKDCYFANCTGGNGLAWGVTGTDDNPFLDLDDIPGTGPENINIAVPEALVYHVWVNDYPGSVRNADTDVTVNVYLAGALAWTGSHTIGGEDADVWFADIDWATRTVTP
jgi:hypothetical protein